MWSEFLCDAGEISFFKNKLQISACKTNFLTDLSLTQPASLDTSIFACQWSRVLSVSLLREITFGVAQQIMRKKS